MPELPELEAVRIRLAPRVSNKLITAATVNPKKAHLLRYPVDNFALELPARRITSLAGHQPDARRPVPDGGWRDARPRNRGLHDPHRGPAGAPLPGFPGHGSDLLGRGLREGSPGLVRGRTGG